MKLDEGSRDAAEKEREKKTKQHIVYFLLLCR